MTCLPGITALKIKNGYSKISGDFTAIKITAFYYVIFSHPDCTVGFGITPNHAFRLAGLPLQEYRRWGIAPRPEESLFYLLFYISIFFFKMQVSFNNSFIGNELFMLFINPIYPELLSLIIAYNVLHVTDPFPAYLITAQLKPGRHLLPLLFVVYSHPEKSLFAQNIYQ